jgi:trimethylamine corrinoid protein
LAARDEEEMMNAEKLVTLLADLKEAESIAFVEEALEQGTEPLELMEAAKEGMHIVGERFANSDYFIPDLVFSGEILKRVFEILRPHLKKDGEKSGKLEKVIVGTVEGDIHDIGKDLVVFMLDISGFEVIDLGINVPVQRFVEAIQETGSTVVGLSGFLTLAFDSMKETVEAIEKAGLRENVKIMIGGGQIDEQVRRFTGADAYGMDAVEAVKLAQGWIGA